MTGTVTKGAAFREDFDLYDGVSTASSRIDSTGGTKTGLKVGNTVDVLSVYGDGTNRTDATLSTAMNAVGSNSVAFEPAVGTWTISNDTIIPDTITVTAPHGVDFNIANGKTLTISGHFMASLSPHFSGDGSVVLSGTPEIYPEWFGDGTSDDTQAIQKGNACSAASRQPLVFTGKDYTYAPSALIDITTTWRGAGMKSAEGTSIVCDTTSYSGVFFRLGSQGNFSNIVVRTDGLTKVGTGIQCATSAGVNGFTGQTTLGPSLWVRGFDKNIDVTNSLIMTFFGVQSDFGNEGFYCAPVLTAANGYITTHTHINCYYKSNTRNVFYDPEVKSQCVTFVGGAIETATGSAEQAYFRKVNNLLLLNLYVEGANTIPALNFAGAVVTAKRLLLQGTGGIKCGAAAGRVTLEEVETTTATDVLDCTFSGQTVWLVLRDARFPASGNVLSGATFYDYEHSSVNGVEYYHYSNRATVKVPVGLTYSTSIDVDASLGNTFEITATDGVAFTINSPTNPLNGQKITIRIINTSGGALGVITWAGAFELAGGSFTSPATANNRSVTFEYNNLNNRWYEISRTSADVSNT